VFFGLELSSVLLFCSFFALRVKLYSIFTNFVLIYLLSFQQQHLWCSGNISAFQALALDSISGRCIYLLPTASVKVMRFFPFCVYILIADFIFVAATCSVQYLENSH
jgi:hypothetical protein